MCLPENQLKLSEACQIEERFSNILNRHKELFALDRCGLYSDKHILIHALVYMRRTQSNLPNLSISRQSYNSSLPKEKLNLDLYILANMALAMDMLEDYPSELISLMMMNYVRVQAETGQLPDEFLVYAPRQQNVIVSVLTASLSNFKTKLLRMMEFNAHIQSESNEYRQSECVVSRLTRQVLHQDKRRKHQPSTDLIRREYFEVLNCMLSSLSNFYHNRCCFGNMPESPESPLAMADRVGSRASEHSHYTDRPVFPTVQSHSVY